MNNKCYLGMMDVIDLLKEITPSDMERFEMLESIVAGFITAKTDDYLEAKNLSNTLHQSIVSFINDEYTGDHVDTYTNKIH